MMRLLLGAVGAAALGCALAACAAIAGLGPYTSEDCPADGCDASVHTIPHEAAIGTGTDRSTSGDDTDAGTGDDGGPEGGGCPEGMLACDGGCLESLLVVELRRVWQRVRGRRSPLRPR